MPVVVVHAVVFVLGGALVVSAPFSALGTFVVPRGVPDRLTRLVFVTMRHVFDLSLRRERSAAAPTAAEQLALSATR